MIPFNQPYLTGREFNYIQDAIARLQISGDGYYGKKVQGWLEAKFDTKKALLTTSCSSALDISAMLIGLKEGDEVILPSYTFVSTANAIAIRGAKPVFAEISEETLNIDPQNVARKITPKTKAIYPVHYAGVACDMDMINELAAQNGLIVVEDAAQGVNAQYQGKYLGTMGDIGCYSFHETKNYSCGEGGAILINRDSKWMERAEIIREKGTNRSQFFRGEVGKYTWVDIGSSYVLSDMLAAFLYAQFEQLDAIQEKRKKIYDTYNEAFQLLQQKGLVRLPVIPEKCFSNYHMFYLLFNSERQRNEAIAHLKENGVVAVFHYIPLHLSAMGRQFGYQAGDLPITENLSSRLLRLPMYTDLGEAEQKSIIDLIYQFFRY